MPCGDGAQLNLSEAAACGLTDEVRALLAAGASPDEGAAIAHAAKSENLEIIILLEEAAANIIAQERMAVWLLRNKK